jgi:hypothetical protein
MLHDAQQIKKTAGYKYGLAGDGTSALQQSRRTGGS